MPALALGSADRDAVLTLLRVWLWICALAASKAFDVATILADDATIVEQHPVVVDLTQNFGQSSETMVSTHLSDQQDTMCDDIITQLERKVRASVTLWL